MNRVCRVCGERKELNTANFDGSYKVLKRTNVRKLMFSRRCKRCRYSEDNVAMSLSPTPEWFLHEKWKALSNRRLKGDIEVCPSLRGRDGSAYLMELWSVQRGLCAVTGRPMTWGRALREDISREGFGTAVGIDRIDNNVGYIRGNIQLVCSQVNFMRSGLSEDAFLEWCEAVVRGQEPPFC